MYRAVLFDLGGVVFPSPFDAFDDYDRGNGLPAGTVRALIRTSSEEGAWAALERGELPLGDFVVALENEAERAGFRLDAQALMTAIAERMGPRPRMVRAIGALRDAGLRVGALTNNWATPDGHTSPTGLRDLLPFDVVIESTVVGLRKPEPRIYELALARLGASPTETVFLDDLGINLKPARALGMTTIKVTDADAALDELATLVGVALD